jgi:hypothetical protein
MSNNSFRFSQKVVGQDRKAIALVIAEALEGQVRYTGAPGFAYEVNDGSTAGSWTVDRDSVVHSPEIRLDEIKSIRPVIDALNMAGLSAEGTMTITLSLEGFGETSLENLRNMLASKETLIKKALSFETHSNRFFPVQMRVAFISVQRFLVIRRDSPKQYRYAFTFLLFYRRYCAAVPASEQQPVACEFCTPQHLRRWTAVCHLLQVQVASIC